LSAFAIIPARGGSKRLPRKNVIDFLGRPIVAYTIEAAIQSACFDKVVVSTEDDAIATTAEQFSAAVDKRPPELATDSAGVVDVCLDYLNREKTAGREWDVMACLYATAPLRNAEDIRATLALLRPGVCSFAMAVTAYDLQPHLALKFEAGSRLSPMWPELTKHRAADLPALRVGNGSTYAVAVADFRRHRTFYGPGLCGYDMPRERSVDIDTRQDLEYAMWLAKRHAATTLL
jgi:pseudaminic acid cytidylyltransferase